MSSKQLAVNPSLPRADNKIAYIDVLGLGQATLNLRDKGFSYLAISKELNETHPDKTSDKPITPLMVSKYVKEHQVEDLSPTKQQEIINTYGAHNKLVELIDSQIDVMRVFLDDLETQMGVTGDSSADYKRMRELNVDLEKLVARKQSLLITIQSLQDKVYNINLLKDIINEILLTIKDTDEDVYKDVVKKMQSNKVLMYAYEQATREKL